MFSKRRKDCKGLHLTAKHVFHCQMVCCNRMGQECWVGPCRWWCVCAASAGVRLLDPGGHQCHKPHATARVPQSLSNTQVAKCQKHFLLARKVGWLPELSWKLACFHPGVCPWWLSTVIAGLVWDGWDGMPEFRNPRYRSTCQDGISRGEAPAVQCNETRSWAGAGGWDKTRGGEAIWGETKMYTLHAPKYRPAWTSK